MEEIADALDGAPFVEPPVPRLTLSDGDWRLLRHAGLRASASELFGLTGAAMCASHAESLKESGAKRPFSMVESRGSRVTADALLAAVRVLGVRSPDVHVANTDAPPMRLANTDPPVLLVGRTAVAKVLPAAQLRFFAGRALASLRPELLVPRMLPVSRIEASIDALWELIEGARPYSPEVRALSRKVPVKSRDRVGQLLENLEKRGVSFERIAEAARHTANRAGLIVAGGVGPVVAALRAKRNADDELLELLEFAASERYLKLRARG
jgi:hypothetical protein